MCGLGVEYPEMKRQPDRFDFLADMKWKKYVLKEQYQDFDGSKEMLKKKFLKKFIWFTIPSQEKKVEAAKPVVKPPPPPPKPKPKPQKIILFNLPIVEPYNPETYKPITPPVPKKSTNFAKFMNKVAEKSQSEIEKKLGDDILNTFKL